MVRIRGALSGVYAGVFFHFSSGRTTLCGDRRGRGEAFCEPGRGAKTQNCFAFLRCADEPSAGIGVVEVQKLKVFFDLAARPSARIGVVEAQKLKVVCVFAARG